MHSLIRSTTTACLLLIPVLLLQACGRKDDPLPPLRFVPAPATDLTVHQQGSDLILNMGYPGSTTTGEALPGLDAVQVWWLQLPDSASSPEVEQRTFEAQAGELFALAGGELTSSIVGDRIEVRFPIPAEVSPEGNTVWAARSVSNTGEVSPFSNLAGLAFAARLTAPSGIALTAEPSGVRVDWTPPEGAVSSNIYRRLATERRFGGPLTTTEADATTFVDTSAQFGVRYIYSVRAVAGTEPLVESEASAEREINYRDTFAPEPPDSLIALGESNGARLVLEASPSSDTTGYIIYRQDPQADFRRITASPVASLEFSDTGLTPGLVYRYYAVAVDAAGNEGAPSSTVTVTIPR